MNKILVFIPTYEEVKNVGAMCQKIMALPVPLDLLFMDDGSPDGTGEELDRLASLHPRMTVIHRSGKLGIGTAHKEGIAYAYKKRYELLVTLDCDFTHDPEKIPDLLKAGEGFQVVLGSRYLEQNSLPGWSIFRKLLTAFGHFLTLNMLGMKYDATGAFRLYDLRTIPASLFAKVRSKSYSFFFESLFVLSTNQIRIREIPIVLPSRTAGHSKLSFFEAYRSTMFLFKLSVERLIYPGRFLVDREADKPVENPHNTQD
jgi:dolichol-phosphate mannosyltransferase